MKVAVLTIFPELFKGFLDSSLIKKACTKDLLSITLTDIRDFAVPPHYHVDDYPYGGGGGMLMKPEPLAAAIEAAKQSLPKAKVVLLAPTGKLFSQARAEDFSRAEELILVCGRYEGIDQRVIDLYIDEEISIGDFVLMGGEVPAMVVIETVARLCDQVLGNEDSTKHESFSAYGPHGRILEGPHYTRPPIFRDLAVPEVLLSGDHSRIQAWRYAQGLEKTRKNRPDLI